MFYLNEYIIPSWGKLRLNQLQPEAVEGWLHTVFESWWTVHGVRCDHDPNLQTPGRARALGRGEAISSQQGQARKKRYKNERRILSFDETARVLSWLDEPNKLVIETCIATGDQPS